MIDPTQLLGLYEGRRAETGARKPGDFYKARGGWTARTPDGHGVSLKGLKVFEHDTGVISVAEFIETPEGTVWAITAGVWRRAQPVA